MQGPPAANTTIVNYDSVGANSAPNLTCAPYDRHNSHRQWGEARADCSEAPSQWRARDAARCSGSLPLIWHAWLSHLVAEPNTAWQRLRCAQTVHNARRWATRRVQGERSLRRLLGPRIHCHGARPGHRHLVLP